jgi:DNA-binding CsgD family transcriptional regulator
LVVSGFLIKSKKTAKRLFLCAYPFFFAMSILFFFPPTVIWTIAVIFGSLLAGGCVAAWGFFLKSSTPKNERIKTVADMLILSNVLMILLNIAAIHVSPYIGLALSMLMLLGAFAFALKLPSGSDQSASNPSLVNEKTCGISGLLAFLCLFIVIITIDSGLMYQVVNPAFVGFEWLTSWYWAIPYIAALFVMRDLSRKANRTHLLYVAIALLGLSFIGFMSLEYTAAAYLAVNTLMLGAFGVYDLFWWSILGEMLEYYSNPAKILGIGLSANVLGVLLGGLIGQTFVSSDMKGSETTLLALAVVCVTLSLLPFLNNRLSFLLKDHAYLAAYSEVSVKENGDVIDHRTLDILSEREHQVASLLLQGKTNRMIAGELSISENTVKYYVKNIYSKYNIQSRAELIIIMLGDPK